MIRNPDLIEPARLYVDKYARFNGDIFVPMPTDPYHATPKYYVDSVASGLADISDNKYLVFGAVPPELTNARQLVETPNQIIATEAGSSVTLSFPLASAPETAFDPSNGNSLTRSSWLDSQVATRAPDTATYILSSANAELPNSSIISASGNDIQISTLAGLTTVGFPAAKAPETGFDPLVNNALTRRSYVLAQIALGATSSYDTFYNANGAFRSGRFLIAAGTTNNTQIGRRYMTQARTIVHFGFYMTSPAVGTIQILKNGAIAYTLNTNAITSFYNNVVGIGLIAGDYVQITNAGANLSSCSATLTLI